MKKLEGAMAETVPAQVNMSADEIVRLVRSLSLGLFQALLQVLQSATTDKGIVRLEVTRLKLEGLLIRFAAELRAPLGLGAVEGGSDDAVVLLQLAFFLVLALAPFLSDAREVSIHEETRDQLTYGGEKAVEVLYTALVSQHWSNAVRRLTIRGDGGAFGTDRGCELLAHLLLSSGHCKLQELHMRMTATGADGVSHIARALQTNTSLIVLCLQGCPEVGDGGVKKLAAMLVTNCTLQELTLSNIGMTAEGLLYLCDALSTQQSLQAISSPIGTVDTHVRGVKALDISQNQIGEGGAAHLGDMLAKNRCLRSLRVDRCSLAEEGIDGEGHGAKDLRANSTLEELNSILEVLNISDNPRLGKAALAVLARSLVGLRRLEMGNMVEMPAAEELAHMIGSNQSLEHLGLQNGSYSAEEWATVILPALCRNNTLKSVDLKYCKGVGGEQVRAALFDLLRVNINIRINTTIQEILLREEVCYPNNNSKLGRRRGLALIVTMERGRPGGAVDRGRLETLFRACGFSVVHVLDPKASDLCTKISSVVKDVLEEDECFLCAINGHGGTQDGKPYILDENKSKIMVNLHIVEPFRQVGHLRGKPKIFLINVCRGHTLYDNSDSVGGHTDAQQVTGPLHPHVREPQSDCLLVFSTSEGSPSRTGTAFVKHLMETVFMNRESTDLLSMMTMVMTMVNDRVNEVQSHRKDPQTQTTTIVGQCCELRHSLRKKLYWNN